MVFLCNDMLLKGGDNDNNGRQKLHKEAKNEEKKNLLYMKKEKMCLKN